MYSSLSLSLSLINHWHLPLGPTRNVPSDWLPGHTRSPWAHCCDAPYEYWDWTTCQSQGRLLSSCHVAHSLVNQHNYGKSPFLLGKSTINDHFQKQTLSLPAGTPLLNESQWHMMPCNANHDIYDKNEHHLSDTTYGFDSPDLAIAIFHPSGRHATGSSSASVRSSRPSVASPCRRRPWCRGRAGCRWGSCRRDPWRPLRSSVFGFSGSCGVNDGKGVNHGQTKINQSS